MSKPVDRAEQQVPEPRQISPAIATALSAACVGHLLALTAAATASVSLNVAVVVGIACSIIALVTLTGLAAPDGRARRLLAALLGGHGVAAAILLSGVAPSAPSAPPLAALAAAAALGGVVWGSDAAAAASAAAARRGVRAARGHAGRPCARRRGRARDPRGAISPLGDDLARWLRRVRRDRRALRASDRSRRGLPQHRGA